MLFFYQIKINQFIVFKVRGIALSCACACVHVQSDESRLLLNLLVNPLCHSRVIELLGMIKLSGIDLKLNVHSRGDYLEFVLRDVFLHMIFFLVLISVLLHRFIDIVEILVEIHPVFMIVNYQDKE